jgi:hypothetical protein
MNVSDEELIRFLAERDGPLGSRWRPHRGGGPCAYSSLYENDDCPWCEAEAKRARERRQPHVSA